MNEKISIRLFDGFEIKKGDKPILENLSNTRKTKLFVAYLLVNRDRPITHQELFELLWSGEDYANPATALRTLLYRFRSMIDKEKADRKREEEQMAALQQQLRESRMHINQYDDRYTSHGSGTKWLGFVDCDER